MKKAIKRVKWALSSSSSNRGIGSHSLSDSMSHDSSRSSSFVPLQHRAAQSSYNHAQTGGCRIEDDDDVRENKKLKTREIKSAHV
jgi:hypothetical protein